MALQVYRYANYLKTYEREQFRSLCKLLNKSQDDYILVANPIIEGRELDALLIKRDAIIVLEFKNYSGGLSASEFGDWHIADKGEDEIVVKGGFGKRNPYGQVLQNRWCTINKFNSLSSPLINAYHTAGLVVFNGEITEEKYDFSGKVRSWFHITDMNHVIEKIENITSDKINFNDALWNEIPNFLNVADYLWTEYDQASLEDKEISPEIEERKTDDSTCSEEIKTDEQEMEEILRATGFKICHKRVEEKRDAVSVSYENLGFSEKTLDFLSKKKEISTLWKHQANAIECFKKGYNVCVTTSTSSGKTEIFQIAALETIAKLPNAKVLAIYPMKALNRDQVERWEKTGCLIGKIDGDKTSMNLRETILRQKQIVVMTPDVLHSFLLGKLNDKNVGHTIKDFIKNIELVIVDELHLYKGLFGTNTAYLFRRLNNIRHLLRKENSFPKYITASATLPNATEHSFNITGAKDFVEIGIEQDSSPASRKTFYFVDRDPQQDTDSNLVSDLVWNLPNVKNADGTPKYKSIAFVDSRKQAGETVQNLNIHENDSEKSSLYSGIYPYRAGYEPETVDVITKHLNDGNFAGIVSTSALEIGVNIDGLNVAIIADVPHNKNSYAQRIGRVGRYGCKTDSFVIVIRTNTFASQLLFDEYDYDIDRLLPDYEPALYLDDENVQNVQALCHVGEHDYAEYNQWKEQINKGNTFKGEGYFPNSFLLRCQKILTGQIVAGYKSIKNVNVPHYAYPLRSFSEQFEIKAIKDENGKIPQEKVSREQLVTEAYVGAIRTTMNGQQKIRERVVNIDLQEKKIYVRIEGKQYIKTEPRHNTFVVPNFEKFSRYATIYYNQTKIYNLDLTEIRYIYGYKESKRPYTPYPDGVFKVPDLETMGTIVFHPSFNNQDVEISDIALIIFETLLQQRAFDRSDINYWGGRLYVSNEIHNRNDKFVAIYDSHKESNITRRVIDSSLLKGLFGYLLTHKKVIAHTICPDINDATMGAIEDLCRSIVENEPETSYKDVGKEKQFKDGTEVIYLEEDAENPDSFIEKHCVYVGKSNDSDRFYNLLINGKFVPAVPIDRIKGCENTEYVDIV